MPERSAGGPESEATERLAGGKLLLDHPAEAVARLRIANPERRNALDHEILAAIAAALEFSGIWFLNGSYQWGCTSCARDDAEHGAPWLARTLDWPFPGLGRHVEVVQMAGAAGDFYSIAWPGFVGVLTGMAPGRFSAAINQAPMYRRTQRPGLRPFDMLANAAATWPVRQSCLRRRSNWHRRRHAPPSTRPPCNCATAKRPLPSIRW